MPYKLRKMGKKYCVFNEDTGENKGCSDSHEMGIKHMRALYVHEGKKKKEVEELIVSSIEDDETKELAEKCGYYADPYSYIPWGVRSFADLESFRDAQASAQETRDLTRDFNGLVDMVMYEEEIADKGAAVAALADEFRKLVKSTTKEASTKLTPSKMSITDQIKLVVKDLLPGLFGDESAAAKDSDEQPVAESTGLMVWKEEETGDFRWIARYSNNFRDNDNPPEIISKESHLRFLDRVEKGLSPYPQLWLWHRPEWKIGVADFLTVDEVDGNLFTIAAGRFDDDKKDAADWLMSLSGPISVSHGMPKSTLKYDPTDPTVITEHETREISPLPDWAAANKFTGFVTFTKQEDDMAIPSEKREKLVKHWGADPALLDRLEALNARDASAAKEAGIESKEQAKETSSVEKDVATEAATNTTATTETATKEVAKTETSEAGDPGSSGTLDYPTRQEVAEAVAAVIQPFLDKFEALSSALDELDKEVKEVSSVIAEVKRSDDERLTALAKESTQASLAGMILSRAVGAPETQIRKDAKLAASKPKEAETLASNSVPIPFISRMLAGNTEE